VDSARGHPKSGAPKTLKDYCANPLNTAVKSFVTMHPGTNVIKLFTVVIYECSELRYECVCPWQAFTALLRISTLETNKN
jgi:hypothetical protein